MAFKPIETKAKEVESIEYLFNDLSTSRNIQSLYSHQADILREYETKAINSPNVTIEMPTGSGKTLVGLLIAEYKRLQGKNRVLYLCPTRQLVNQVVEQSNKDYGIKAIAFTGTNREYDQADKHAYKNGDAIAVTTISSLFNSRPWFEEPRVIIIDDAHTAENYISACWSVNISRLIHTDIYNALFDVIKSKLSYEINSRISSDDRVTYRPNKIEMLSSLALFDKKEEILECLSLYLDKHESLKYSWSMIKDNLEACNIFFDKNEFTIRPLIPPSLENLQFKNADQRVFMSATLGSGGDLQRITGIKSFYNIPIPAGWDKQGMGRKFFMFPTLFLDESDTGDLLSKLLIENNRTVILVTSDDQVLNFKSQLNKEHPEIDFFTAKDIEKSKDSFLKSENAAIVMANRFDGIDFAEEQSRLLILTGIPYASNLQESFFQYRMNASVIFNDRNKTRLIQAIGRCTRSPKDYSAICVIGDRDLTEWLVLESMHKYFHPELQSELKFGLSNSKDQSPDDFMKNYGHFIAQDSEWKYADNMIKSNRSNNQIEEFEGAKELAKASELEVEYQYKLWNRRFEECHLLIPEILKELQGGKALSGYRAFWNFQGAYISHILHTITKKPVYLGISEAYLENLIKICPSSSWSRSIISTDLEGLEYDNLLVWNIENLQSILSEKNMNAPNKFNKYLKTIEDSISNGDLENINLKIGELLGFISENKNSSGAPDPYWQCGSDLVIVFEDKLYDEASKSITITDIRQAALHDKWIRDNVSGIDEQTIIKKVIITNSTTTCVVGKSLADDLLYWNYDDFIDFSRQIISLARQYPTYYKGENDSQWKDFFAEEFYKRKLGPNQILEKLGLVKNL